MSIVLEIFLRYVIINSEVNVMEYHTIEPVYNRNSKILILGSFPSVKSRETGFYYGHKQNRFWKVISEILDDNCPDTIDEKREFLKRHNIALWDVIASCDIVGSADSAIKNETPNDIDIILNNSNVKKIFTNGTTAYKLFCKYNKGLSAEKLPSTSPANAAFSLERLIDEWGIIKNFLN